MAWFRDRQLILAGDCELGFHRRFDLGKSFGRSVAKGRAGFEIRHVGDPRAVRLRPEQIDMIFGDHRCGRTSVAPTGSGEIRSGTLFKILHDLGLKRDDLN